MWWSTPLLFLILTNNANHGIYFLWSSPRFWSIQWWVVFSLVVFLRFSPNLNFNLLFLTEITIFMALTYGLIITVLCLIIFFIIQFFHGKNIQISFISPTFLSLSFSILCGLYLIIHKANHDFYRSFFDAEILNLLKNQSIALIFLALLGIFVFYAYITYRGHVFFWGYFILFICWFK